MNESQADKIRNGKGFVAALDQSGGSTPKALRLYGVTEDQYSSETEMFDLVHAMRERIVTSPSFTGERIIAAILFEKTMDRTFAGMPAADYLWDVKSVVPFLKVDKGLQELANGVQLLKPIDDLDDLLVRAKARRIFGTKMRSVIKEANPDGIAAIVAQQFELGERIAAADLVPILEPEVDIKAPDKEECEFLLLASIAEALAARDNDRPVMFKVTIPSQDGFYTSLMKQPSVMRVVALSGGYSRAEANERLARNPGLIASFSRALTEGLTAQQTQQEFDAALGESIRTIYEASIT